MTAKNIKSKSIALDAYDTPIWTAEECVEHLVVPEVDFLKAPLILEPGAGEGNIVGAVRRRFKTATIHAFDIRKNLHWRGVSHGVKGWDFLKCGDANQDVERWLSRFPTQIPDYDLAIGNPPFTFAREWVERCTMLARYTVLLLRQGFMSSAERAIWWKHYRPKLVKILPDRPKFVSGKPGDTADYCWIVWKGQQWSGATTLDWMPTVPLERRKRG